jgi:NADPH oxidase
MAQLSTRETRSILLFPVCRNLMRILKPLNSRFLSLEHNIYLHKATAYALLFFVIVHVNAHYANFFIVFSHCLLICVGRN